MAYAALLFSVFLWGTSFVSTKFALGVFDLLTVIFLRMVIASVLFLPFLPGVWRRLAYRAGDWRLILLMAACEPGLYFLMETYALTMTTASAAGMISAVVPLLIALAAWPMFNEKPTRRSAGGLVLSIGGVVILSLAGEATAAAPAPLLGNLLEFGAMISAAIYMLILKKLSTRYDTWFLTFVQSVLGAVFFIPGIGGLSPLPGDSGAWIAVFYLGSLVTLAAFGLYNYAMAQLPATRVSAHLNLIPLIAVLTGWLFLDESLNQVQLVASLAILAGVILGTRPGPKRETARSTAAGS